MDHNMAWYKAQCWGCDYWYPVALMSDGKQMVKPCQNCGCRYIDIDNMKHIPAEVAEEWKFSGPELLSQEEMTKMLAIRTKHAIWLEQLNG